MFEFSAETYYKSMQNQIDYKDNADERSPVIETQLLYGKGRAYGLELLLKKNQGKLTGWLGYTLSRTEKQIDGINQNHWYAARQDRTHDISIVTMYDYFKTVECLGSLGLSNRQCYNFPEWKIRSGRTNHLALYRTQWLPNAILSPVGFGCNLQTQGTKTF